MRCHWEGREKKRETIFKKKHPCHCVQTGEDTGGQVEAVRDAAVILAKSDERGTRQTPGARRRAGLLEKELGIDRGVG